MIDFDEPVAARPARPAPARMAGLLALCVRLWRDPLGWLPGRDAMAIVQAAPEAIVRCDERGRIAFVNPAAYSVFGHAEMLGLNLGDLLPDVMRQSLASWLQRYAVGTRVIAHETHGRRVDGTSFPCTISCSVRGSARHAQYSFMVRDTTDAKWAEQELLLRDRALESAGDGVVVSSMLLPGEPIIYANAAFQSITGYGYSDVIGRNCRFLQGDDRHQPEVEEMRAAIRERRGCRVVMRNYRKDGTLFWNQLTLSPVVREDGAVTHYVGVQTDITDRIAQEETLRRRTERLNTVFELSPDGFVAIDAQDTVQIVNPAFERMTGLPATELIGRSREEFEDRLAAILRGTEAIDAKLSGPDTLPAAEDELRRAVAKTQGELLHVATPVARTLLRRVRRSTGAGHETVMVFRDMTRELEVDRMKSEFLSMAAHELRTPMASIFGFTELLLKRKFDDTRRQDMLSTIHRQAGVLINLVNELLDLARIESRRGKDFRRRVQPLQPIIENTVAGILVHNDPRRVSLLLPMDPIPVDVDSEKLSLAITNVVSNAYKYSPQGGGIDLEIVERVHKDVAQIGMRVTDRGIGMTPEQRARLFERFFRADTSGNIPGTGLGMVIVKEIVELHGGDIDIDTQFGRGTTVTLWLPVARSAPTADARARQASVA